MGPEEREKRTISIEESIIGIFGISEDNEIVEATLYPKDPKQIAAALGRQRNGEITREVAATLEKLIQRGFNAFVFSNRSLAESVRAGYEVQAEAMDRTDAGDYIRNNLLNIGLSLGAVKDASQLQGLSHDVTVSMARQAVKRTLSERDSIINQAVPLLDELDRSLNALSGKLREWYGLHFPELSRLIDDHKLYATIVDKLGDRADIEAHSLGELGLHPDKTAEISRLAQNSMGAPLDPEDLSLIGRLARNLIELHDFRDATERYITVIALESAPHLSEMAGPILASRLIQRAGGLRRLSMMPSSTIQLLGAEKAMFRAMKTRSKPPKHGLIFQHPNVHSSPRGLRGRTARSLAAKLAIAARKDFFSEYTTLV